MASIVFFIQHILVALERFLVELMFGIMVKRWDPLCRFFTQPQTCRRSRLFSLLQLNRSQLTVVCCNRRCVWTPHLTRRRTSCVILMCLFWLSSTVPLSPLYSTSSLLSSNPSSCPSTSSSNMWWTNSLCTLAKEDLDTLAENPHTERVCYLLLCRHVLSRAREARARYADGHDIWPLVAQNWSCRCLHANCDLRSASWRSHYSGPCRVHCVCPTTGQLDVHLQRGTRPQQFIIETTK